jgi:hypothetical protein
VTDLVEVPFFPFAATAVVRRRVTNRLVNCILMVGSYQETKFEGIRYWSKAVLPKC